MTARLVGDELDFDLASLATTLLVVIVIIVGSHGVSWSLDASGIAAVEVIARRRIVEASRGIGDVGHYDEGIESIEGLCIMQVCQTGLAVDEGEVVWLSEEWCSPRKIWLADAAGEAGGKTQSTDCLVYPVSDLIHRGRVCSSIRWSVIA